MNRLCLSLNGISQGCHCHIAAQIIENLAGNVDRIPFDRHGHIAGGIGNTCVYAFSCPYRSRYRDIFVCLGNSQVIVAVACGKIRKFHCGAAALKGLLRQGLAAVYNDFHLCGSFRIGRIGDIRFNSNRLLLRQNGTHGISIQRIQNGKVIVFCGINTIILHCVVNSFLT